MVSGKHQRYRRPSKSAQDSWSGEINTTIGAGSSPAKGPLPGLLALGIVFVLTGRIGSKSKSLPHRVRKNEASVEPGLVVYCEHGFDRKTGACEWPKISMEMDQSPVKASMDHRKLEAEAGLLETETI